MISSSSVAERTARLRRSRPSTVLPSRSGETLSVTSFAAPLPAAAMAKSNLGRSSLSCCRAAGTFRQRLDREELCSRENRPSVFPGPAPVRGADVHHAPEMGNPWAFIRSIASGAVNCVKGFSQILETNGLSFRFQKFNKALLHVQTFTWSMRQAELSRSSRNDRRFEEQAGR